MASAVDLHLGPRRNEEFVLVARPDLVLLFERRVRPGHLREQIDKPNAISWEGFYLSRTESRLKELGISLPTPTPPIATFVGSVQAGTLLFVSGQVSIDASGGVKGIVGDSVSPDEAYRAARICGINILAQVKAACGELDLVMRVVRLGGFVQAGPEFFDIPKVINGASDLMVEVLGKERGAHSRAAVGVYRLPLNFAVEVDAILELGLTK